MGSSLTAKSGRRARNFSSHFALIFGRPRFVIRHALANRDVVTTFCVTATVCSRFNTACHHPSGTYMISPGRCTASMGGGRPASRHADARVLGYILANHVTDSPSRPIPFGLRCGFSKTPGVGGNRHHRLRPLINAFHADVASGSTWTLLPDRGGPMTTQRYGGRRFSPTC
jgi:hypothetical protein